MNGLTNLQKKSVSPWDEKFGWYHYDGDAVFHASGAKLGEDAKRYADAGITAVILFGAHFRFSFWAYWEEIEDFIARFTAAFHEKGIKVIEHHSSHLTYRPLTEAYWKKHLRPGAQLATYPDFYEKSQQNPVLGGQPLDSFAQIDGRTLKPCLSSYIHTEGKDMFYLFKHYNGNAHCFHHPAFIKAYTGHLENIIKKSGVDGMMNDDVQWFGGGHACACDYCREKFHAETGYTLPGPEDWEGFYENYENPGYIAWKKFKKKQSGDFHRAMDAFYQSIGFRPLRPAYCAEVLPFDTTCYGFEAASELWDYIFQECCGIIKHSYICFAGEAVHRFAMAKRRGVPSMALLYPVTPDSAYASWALCRSWGQLYTGTGGDISKLYDKPYRAFEEKHKALFWDPEKVSDLAFYFSTATRDYSHKDAPRLFMKPFMAYLEAAYVSGISADMVFEDDTVETLCEHRAVVLPHIAVLTEKEAEKLKAYAAKGGTLLIFGAFAEKDGAGGTRTVSEALALIGLQAKALGKEYIGPVTAKGESFRHAISPVTFISTSGKAAVLGEKGEILGVEEEYGRGKVIYFPGDVSFHPIQPAVWVKGARTPVDRSYTAEMRDGDGRLLQAFLGGKALSCGDPDVLVSLYKTAEKTYTLHLVNTKGMLPEKDGDASRTDPIPPFCAGAEKTQGFFVDISGVLPKGDWGGVLYSPEFDGEISLRFSWEKDIFRLFIPKGVFAGYAVAQIKEK